MTKRPRTKASILNHLEDREAHAVFRRLLAAHRELQPETRQIARLLLGEVSFKSVAKDVEQAVRGLDLDDLGSRAGNHKWGYTSPTEAAWELLEQTVEPFNEDLKRRIGLGHDEDALEVCKGIVLGLYRVRDGESDDFLQWVSDGPAKIASRAVGTWCAGGNRKRPKAQRKRREFSPDFVTSFVPEWDFLAGRV